MLDIDRIKSDFAHALRRRCSEGGCTLRLDGLTNRVVLKGDGICQDRKMCDCIVFVVNGSVIIGIVELKGKTVHTSEVADKLTNSSEIALSILEKYADWGTKPTIRHLLLHKGLDSSELRKIERRRIGIRGKRYDIIAKPCGVSFSTVISELRK